MLQEWYDEEFYFEEEQEAIQPINVIEVDTRSLCEVKELYIRILYCLKIAGYDTVRQVKEASLEDSYMIRNLGARSLKEIEEVFKIKFA
jgi:DNA-directed RNA polymerase alpha subunit